MTRSAAATAGVPARMGTSPWSTLLHDGVNAVGLESGGAREHLVQNRPHGEEIGTGGGDAPEHLFGSHVLRRTKDRSRAGQRRPRHISRLAQRDAEVEYFRAVRRQKDVRRFEVSVRDAAAMQRLERTEYFEANLHGLGDWYWATTQACGERLALETLHGDEQLSIGLADLVQLTDVRMIDAGGKASLARETLACGRVSRALVPEHFQGDRPFQLFVQRRIDHAHAAFTQRVGDAVSTDTCRHAGDADGLDALVQQRGRPFQKGRRAFVRGEQLFDFQAKRRVVVAGCGKVRRPTLGRQRARFLEQVLQPQPVFRTQRRHT